jgi:F-type H+-transporting ATPase subunit a
MISTLLAAAFSALIRPQLSGGFNWFQLIPGFDSNSSVGQSLGLHHPSEAAFIPMAWGMVALVLGFAVLARMGLEQAKARQGINKFLPDEGISARNLGEMLTDGLYGMVEANLGAKEAKNFFPLIASFFTYILVSNLCGFIPGLGTVTSNLSSNLALAFVSFITFNWAGLSRDPVGYAKHLAGPVAALMPVFFVLETVSLCIRPISLTFRLSINMIVDHMLQGIARNLGGEFLGIIGEILLPVPLYFLGLLVCFIQAFIFSLLSTIYVSMSLPHGGSDAHGHDAHGHDPHAKGLH